MKKDEPVHAAIGGLGFVCTVCRSDWFLPEAVRLPSPVAFSGWVKGNATGLICAQCGYMHLFYNSDLRLIPGDPG